MSEKKLRRLGTAQKKLKLAIESIDGESKMAEICRRES